MQFTVCGHDKDQYLAFCEAMEAESASKAVKLIETEGRSPDDLQVCAVFEGDVTGLLIDPEQWEAP